MKRQKIILSALVALAAIVVASIAVAGAREPRDVAMPDEGRIDEIRAAALAFAASNGEPSPTLGHLVPAPRQDVVAQTMRGVTVDSDQDVYAVAMSGSFVGYMASTPNGVPAPTGTDLLVVFDAGTLRVVDWSLTDEAPDLSRYGTPLKIIG